MRNMTYYLLTIFSGDLIGACLELEFNTKKAAMEYLRGFSKTSLVSNAKIRKCTTVYER